MAAASSSSFSSSSSLNLARRPVSFSTDSNYLAYSGADGRLRIWESSTGILKQEYTASSHLSAMCTCLAWVPVARTAASTSDVTMPLRKKRKKGKGPTVDQINSDVLAMGTQQGNILIYSVVKGDIVSELTKGHTDAVHDLCWHMDSDSMFSCSQDQRIVHWCLSKGCIISHFKRDTGPIYAIAVLPDGKTILSAGKAIKWWDVKKRELLKTFTGHASKILQLSLVSFPNEPVEKGYVLSAACGDRLISVWQLDSTDRSALISFRLSDEPASINISRPTSRSEKVRLSVVTRGGVLHVFEHQLNGNVRRPLEPTVTLQMTLSGEKKNSEPSPIPVLSAHLCDDVDRSALIAYGDLRKVGFEKLPHSSFKPHMCLVRNLSSVASNNLDSSTSATKVRIPTVSKEVKHLAPGHLLGSRPSHVDPGGGSGSDDSGGDSSEEEGNAEAEKATPKKRKLNEESAGGRGLNGERRQLPMEDRLSALNLDIPGSSTSVRRNVVGDIVIAPQVDNVTHLLLQGLHSRDENMLDRVFKLSNRSIVDKTVCRLPAKVVFVLLKEIHRRIFEIPEQSLMLLWWLRSLLTHHTSYLSTYSDLDVLLRPLYQLMDSRTVLFEKMSQLKGRMDLVVSQLNMQQETAVPTPKALCTYQDESSDETDSYIDELLPSASESEADNWDEFSEAEEVDRDKMQEDDEDEDEEEAADNSDDEEDEEDSDSD